MYAVGNNGNIAHYDGRTWKKIEIPSEIRGLEFPFTDIIGNRESKEVIAVYSSYHISPNSYLIRIKESNTEVIYKSEHSLYSAWFKDFRKIFICGGGLSIGTNHKWKKNEAILSYYKFRVRGDAINDVWVTGAFGYISHFNGINWKSNTSMYMYGNYYGLDIKSNLIVSGGWKERQAIITFIKK